MIKITTEAHLTIRKALMNAPVNSHLMARKHPVTAVAYSPDQSILASNGKKHAIILWDTETFQPIGEPVTESSYISSLAISPDGNTLVSAGLLRNKLFFLISLRGNYSANQFYFIQRTQIAWFSAAMAACQPWGLNLLIFVDVTTRTKFSPRVKERFIWQSRQILKFLPTNVTHAAWHADNLAF